MTRLLSAGIPRVLKNRLLWFGTFLLAGSIVFATVRNYLDMQKYPDVIFYTSDSMIFGVYEMIGMFVCCFTGWFLGTEYSDGTIRNKLVIGNSRTQVYLSNLILSFAASLLACIATILVSSAVSLPLLGRLHLTLQQAMQYFGIGILTIASLSSIFTLISMLVSNKAAGSVIDILIFIVLLLLSIYVFARLDAPEYTTPYLILSVDGVPVGGDPVPNPAYLRGTARSVYEFFYDLFPTGQCLQLASREIAHPLRAALFSLGSTAAITAGGIFVFHKKDLK